MSLVTSTTNPVGKQKRVYSIWLETPRGNAYSQKAYVDWGLILI
jgi:hypothetical protein